MTQLSLSRPGRRLSVGLVLVFGLGLAGCAPTAQTMGLSSGLTARMDQPGAQLDRAEALGIINQYRASLGVPPLTADAGLDAQAQQLAQAYASSGNTPRRPDAVPAMRVSAGYANFAETFSGWRNSPADAQVLADRASGRAGLGVAYNPNGAYGIHWILLLDR